MKYSENFERDYKWYLKWKDIFNFDGAKDYIKKEIEISENNKVINKISFESFKNKYPLQMRSENSFYLVDKLNENITYELYTYPMIVSNSNGRDAKYCFYIFDSQGKIIPTKEPELLYQIHKCKGSINFNIKMWAESRVDGTLPLCLFSQRIAKEKYSNYKFNDDIIDMETELELLPWMVEAVENQKFKFYE